MYYCVPFLERVMENELLNHVLYLYALILGKVVQTTFFSPLGTFPVFYYAVICLIGRILPMANYFEITLKK